MPLTPFDALACPLDGQILHRDGNSWRCESGHSFDIARQGYVHLLPVQKKRSREPGDSKDMVAARQRFLNAGFYDAISDAVNRIVAGGLPEADVVRLLDAGCGEGYYTRRLGESQPASGELAVVGLDISKWAVLAAAKQDKQMNWVVGSNANLPVLPGTLDAVLCLFGFPVYGEFHRVLKSGGLVLQVDAGPDHLRELREIIYPELKPEKTRSEAAPEGFKLVASEPVRHTLTLAGQEVIADLLAMTPHLYRASAEGRERATKLSELTVTVDVVLHHYAKL